MSTPSPGRTNPPAKTPGFAAALFGLWSSNKPSRPVESSTVPTPPVTRSPRSSHRRPMDITLTSPYEQDTSIAQTRSHTTHASAVDLLDIDGPTGSPEGRVQPAAASFPSKSPWKSPSASSAVNGFVPNGRFSVGNLKASTPANRRSNISSVRPGLAGRRRYKPSTLLLSAKRRKTGPLNPVNAVNALQHSQNLFQPSSRQAEARSNYTSFRAGKRLLGSSQRGGSRLVPTDPSNNDAATTTVQDEPPSSPVEPATKRRKQVMFGVDSSMDSKPVESEMMTPARPSGGGFVKKKGTPFKVATDAEPGPVTPSKGPASSLPPPSPPSLVPRPVMKLELGSCDYVFEGTGESEQLGRPVATRTPPFLAERTVLTSRDATVAITPRTFYEPLTTERKEKIKSTETTEASAQDAILTKASTSSGPPTTSVGWGDQMKEHLARQRNQWKCQACSAFNEATLSNCKACEAVRPGHEGKASASNGGGVTSRASVGTGGFTFGGVTSAPAASDFSFGSAPAPSVSAPSIAGFSFGGASSTSTSGGSGGSGGGFKFGGLPPASNSGNIGGGFKFGSNAAGTSAATVPADDSGSTQKEEDSSSVPSATTLFGGAPTVSSENKEATKRVVFSFASAPAPAPTNGEKKPFQFNVSGDEKKSEEGAKSTFVFSSSSAPSGGPPNLPLPTTEPSSIGMRPENDGKTIMPSFARKTSETKTDSSSEQPFSFGASTSSSTPSGFSFGASNPAPVSEPAPAPFFNFGQQPSFPNGSTSHLPITSIPSKDASSDDRSKRQRGPDNGEASAAPSFGGNVPAAPAASTPAFSFGGSAPASAPTTFGSQPSTEIPAIPFGSRTLAAAPAPSGFSFGGTPAPAAPSSTFRFESAQDGDVSTSSAPKFGSDSTDSTIAAAPAFGDPFGSIPAAPTTASGFSFGGGSSSGSAAPSFGSAPAPLATTFGGSPAPIAPSFGSATTPAPTAPTFGSQPAPATFGATPSIGAASFSTVPAAAPFGSTPAAPPPQTFGVVTTPAAFGATPVGSFGGGGFGGSAPATAPPPFGAQGFGVAPAPALGGFGAGGFGAPPAPSAPSGFGATVTPGGFGGDGFGGQPAGGTAPQFSIGSSGGAGTSKTPGRRRILKARRPRPA